MITLLACYYLLEVENNHIHSHCKTGRAENSNGSSSTGTAGRKKEVLYEKDVLLVWDLYVPGWKTTPPADQVCTHPENGTILLVTVISASENIAQRQDIRAGWGSFGRRRKDIQIVYQVGRSNNKLNSELKKVGRSNNKLNSELKKEAEKYSDLVAVSYTHLTLPTTPYV